MKIQHVLVYVNSEKTAAADAAFKLAKQHDAALTALFVVPFIQPPVMLFYIPDSETIARERQEGRSRGLKMKKRLQLKADEEGVAFNFVLEEGFTLDSVVNAAKYADVTVVNRDDPGVGVVLIQDLLYGSGHPVFVVSDTTENIERGHRIVIGWKANATTVRAVSAALPLLQKASETAIIEVIKGQVPVSQRSGNKLTEFLYSHEILAQHEVVDHHDEVTGLLQACERANADLLVMGGYAHSRAREWVVGGVTQYMLSKTPLPLFLMH